MVDYHRYKEYMNDARKLAEQLEQLSRCDIPQEDSDEKSIRLRMQIRHIRELAMTSRSDDESHVHARRDGEAAKLGNGRRITGKQTDER